MIRFSVSALYAAVIAVFVTAGSPAGSARAGEFTLSDNLTVRDLADRVVLVTHSFPWAANSLAVLMPDSTVVLIDTPYTPDATATLLDWLDGRWHADRYAAVVTGFHIDNLGGAGELIHRGVTVYGADMTAGLLRERSAATMAAMDSSLAAPGMERYRDAFRAMRFEPPTATFPAQQGLVLSFGGETLEIFWPGKSHTSDNTVVYFPAQRLLFGGCMVCNASAARLGFTGDADLDEWPRSLETVLARFPDAAIVAPGHGAVGDRGLIEHTISLFE